MPAFLAIHGRILGAFMLFFMLLLLVFRGGGHFSLGKTALWADGFCALQYIF
jgi:hypothetical protein